MPLSYRRQKLAGWGRYAPMAAAVGRPERRHEVAAALRPDPSHPHGIIARGSGLAYGDAAGNPDGRVLTMSRLNRFLDFDSVHGLISCEAGTTLADVIGVALPKGWFPVVTPGTARATIGGCLACDVHGRNHHRVGSFSQHVIAANLLLADGEVRSCGPDRDNELFWATAGGMGLTGIVLDATLALQPVETAYVLARNIPAADLDGIFRVLEETGDEEYSVAWLDGTPRGAALGRGVVMLGRHAKLADLPAELAAHPLTLAPRTARTLPLAGVLGAPFSLPLGSLQACLVTFGNALIYRAQTQARREPTLVSLHDYLYPLDTFDNWNVLLGRRGFFEYQVVLPVAQARDAVLRMLELLAHVGLASFFTSIKRLGASAPGPLSFPAPGYAFSFDVPAGGDAVLVLLDRCDEITLAAGGRVYLAKDARVNRDHFAAMYPRLREWRGVIGRYNANGVLASSMGRRLGLCA